MTRVFDCFTFFDEFDVLALRFAELCDVVDRFVLVEASTTHSGQPKDVSFADRADEFTAFADRITVVHVTDLPTLPNRWIAEQVQRNAIKRGLDGAYPEDIVVVSDCDEIPRASTIRQLPALLPDTGDVVGLSMPSHYYALNLKSDEWFDATRATRRATLDFISPQELRTSHITNRVPDAGWHFSYLARTNERAERIARKAHSFAHSEFDLPELTNVDQLRDMLANDELWWTAAGPIGPRLLHRVPIDGSFPKAVRSDRERWHDFIVEGAGEPSYELNYQWRRLRREAKRGAHYVRRTLRRR